MNAQLANISVVVFPIVTIHRDPTSVNVKKATEVMEQTAYVCIASHFFGLNT